MYDKEIDVAAIMRKIKSEAASESLSPIQEIIEKTGKFEEISYRVPPLTRLPQLIRRPVRFIFKVFAKSVRYTVKDQNTVNAETQVLIKTLAEGQLHLLKVIETLKERVEKLEDLQNKENQ